MEFKKTGKSVLLFSGGMDSVMYSHLLNPDILLRIGMNEKYEIMEGQHADRVVSRAHWSNKYLRVDNVFDLSRYEREDYIIPGRNVYIITLASLYGEKIYLSSVHGDRSLDKDKTFYTMMTSLLNHIWDEQHWTEKREFTMTAPFKDYTKTELLKQFLNEGGDAGLIYESYSCYEGWNKPCGLCKPCVRKAVAMINNKLDITDYFMHNPITGIDSLVELINAGTYDRGKENTDFLSAWENLHAH
jgi:7-cyano-7-deazaguanine synthase in queuosine biosynthesis